jgi:glycine dehydrogenase subunit 1
MYMASLGHTGMRELAGLNHDKCEYLKSELKKAGFEIAFDSATFNEFVVKFPTGFKKTHERLKKEKILAGLSLTPYYPELTDHYLLCVTETMAKNDMDDLIKGLSSSGV